MTKVTLDGNEACARVAYKASEVIAIYPITPASPMGEWADLWASEGRPNLWGDVPEVVEMQSEAGAAAALHGAVQTGALGTTFTASQGLLLMIPNMYKIAGELTPAVIHVAARSVATHALSIFGDHSDIYAARGTGWAILVSASVQEAQDFAAIAHAATLATRVPFLHAFDGFRTSHEVQKISALDDAALASLLDPAAIAAHRARALDPEHPVLRGTAQNPDVFFQAREAANPFYEAAPAKVRDLFGRFAKATGRRYDLFEYVGHPEAERVLVVMGSAAEAAHECVEHLVARGEKVGLVKVRLFRPFAAAAFRRAIPPTVRAVAVLDRAKEPGALGEPLLLDAVAALAEGDRPMPVTIGVRYGLSSKEFAPAMAKACLDELAKPEPKRRATVGIRDDLTHTSLDWDPTFSTAADDVVRAVFFGLGSDGTVGAAKNAVKILGETTDLFTQGYFVYDSKKAGSVTVSHLRISPRPIRSTYLVQRARFIGCHHPRFVERYDILSIAEPGGVFLLNTPLPPGEVWDFLPAEAQRHLVAKRLRFFVLDASRVAREAGLPGRTGTIMMTCFFAVSGVLPRDEAIARLKEAIVKTYGRKGDLVVRRNFAAVDAALSALVEVPVPLEVTSHRHLLPAVAGDPPDFVRDVLGRILAGEGDALPTSALPPDGTFPTGTARYEKRAIAEEIPVWFPEVCIECNKCVFVCPHAVIRAKAVPVEAVPGDLPSLPWKGREVAGADGWRYVLAVSPDDCTGCAVCVEVCPARRKDDASRKALEMRSISEAREAALRAWEAFERLPEVPRDRVAPTTVKGAMLYEPLFEFSGACAGCGETPYLKLLTQLFGDRLLVANATGCSSIYGGNLPTTPWAKNAEGKGPAWSNSLFEDAAEFGLGFRLALERKRAMAVRLLRDLAPEVGENLAGAILAPLEAPDGAWEEAEIRAQRERIAALGEALRRIARPEAARLRALADALLPKMVWIVGGDGWAYDIGYGGLDHVLASGRDVNLLVLDTEVYSNTGGQMSKATPKGAVAKFAAAGKPRPKKDLARMALVYGDVYVARVAFGANDAHTLRAFREAASYPGPSLVVAYSHCIAHGYNLRYGPNQQRRAVESGYWPLFRFDPRRLSAGENPFQIDSRPPKIPLAEYIYHETRYKMLATVAPDRAKALLAEAEADIARQWKVYESLADRWRRLAEMLGGGNEGRGGRAVVTPDLSTRYLGFDLPHPVVAGASPLTREVETARGLVEAGASALVLESLFEEELREDEAALFWHTEPHAESYAEALSYFPDHGAYRVRGESYLERIRDFKAAFDVPVIASLNAATPGGWVEFAKAIEEAGADALELNICFLAADPEETAEEVENRYLSIVRAVRNEIRIPLAVKVGPYFSAFANFARRVADAGANGMVLFNRFYQPDIDIENCEVVPNLLYSTAPERRIPLRWIAILRDRVPLDLAASTGIHSAEDVVRMTMAGADACQVVSATLRRGPRAIAEMVEGLRRWMAEHEYESVAQMKGSMSHRRAPDPERYERAAYFQTIRSYSG